MHPFLTSELAGLHERDLRRDRAATGPARRRRPAPLAALALLLAALAGR
jgi:hypothetical protein